MPIYEYEPTGHDCLICMGRVEVLQGIHDPTLCICPTCGMDVKRVVSRPNFDVASSVTAEKAAAKGFTTFKRVQKGIWEKTAGEGPDVIAGTKEDMAAVEAEKRPSKVLDLDAQ